MTAIEDLINQALPPGVRQIGDIYEGSKASRAALAVYGQTRDELLAEGDWPFAVREVALTATGSIPPSPWGNIYTYPSDCLRLRNVKSGSLTGGTRSLDPQAVLFQPWNDSRTGTNGVRTILCDLSPVVAVYTGRVVDPASWNAVFSRALIDRLKQKLLAMLQSDQNAVRGQVALASDSEISGRMNTDMIAPQLPMSAPSQQQGEAR